MTYNWKPKYQVIQEDVQKKESAWFDNNIEPTQKTSWWEQPASVAEKATSGIGGFINKIPVVRDIAKGFGNVFNWIDEHTIIPAATLFTPDIPWEAGESFTTHARREYDAWDAPTYVKGAIEFANPVYWIPWLGWAGKGARAISAGSKVTKAISLAEDISGRVGSKIRLPLDKTLDTVLFGTDAYKKFAMWAENKPILSSMVKRLGGESAFVKSPEVGESALDTARRAIVKRATVYDMRNGVKSLITPKVRAIGDPVKVLGIEADARVANVIARDGSSTYLSDLIEGYSNNPTNYTFSSLKAESMTKSIVNAINEIREIAVEEGVKVPKEFTFHRIVKGIEKEVKGEYEVLENGSKFDRARHRETMKAGATGEGGKRIVQYDNNPLNVIDSTIDYYMKQIVNKRFDDVVGNLGKKPLDKFAELFPDVTEGITKFTSQRVSAEYAKNAIQSVLSRNGTRLPPATITKIRKALPEIADRIEQAFSFAPMETNRVIGRISKDFWKAAKVTPRQLKVALSEVIKNPKVKNVEESLNMMGVGKDLASLKNATLGNLEEALLNIGIEKKMAFKEIENLYKEQFKNLTQLQKDSLRSVLSEADSLVGTARMELKPLIGERSQWMKSFGTGFGSGGAVFRNHPAFGNKIFPKEVVDLIEPALRDQGNKWLQGLSKISGIGRTLTAALDVSAPFIQGLNVLGRNPVAWGKAVVKQFDFLRNPENFYKYMSDPENLKIRTERIMSGGSSQTFEFMEAVPQIQKVLGKKITGATYGRAEAAFSGFGEVARNEMWKALRNKAIVNGKVDAQAARDIARTIDRMTGTMSTEALGTTRTQRDFENAFVFFAPRYTRASLSYVGDIFKGGITGAEARKSLGALMASGAAFYNGISKVLGQEPNFDITSPQFMTIKIGNQHLGIGGAFYGLARTAANVVGKAATQPLDLISLSKDDNPFIKFMYQRTSPLTSALTQAVEGENYIGQPFESIADWGKFVAEKFIPISLQDTLSGDAELTSTAAQIFGARTFPKSAWELQEDAKEKLANEMYQTPYVSLNKSQKKTINNHPSVEIFQAELDKRTEQTGDTLSVGFLNRQREIDDTRDTYIQRLNQLSTAYQSGMLDGVEFKDEVKLAKYGYGKTLEHINSNPKYTDVLKRLNQPRDISKSFVGDIAYDELINATYSGQFENEAGIFDFDKYNSFTSELQNKYGADTWNYVLQRIEQGKEDYPQEVKNLEEAKKVLSSYWGVINQVQSMNIDPESKFGQRVVQRLRNTMKLQNPLIKKYLELYYSGTK